MVRVRALPTITIFIHPVDVKIHPTYQPGYRWAVHLGSGQPSNLERCMQAGHCQTLQEARLIGDSHAAAIYRTLYSFGIDVTLKQEVLDVDPIPVEADSIPLEFVERD